MKNDRKIIDDLKIQLDNGEITSDEYREKVMQYMENNPLETPKRGLKINFRSLLLKIALILFIVLLGILVANHTFKKEYDYSYDLHNLPEPIQTATTQKPFTTNIGKTSIYVEPIFNYHICGKVVTLHQYYEYKTEFKYSPTDVTLAWGFLADDSDNLFWSKSMYRYVMWRTTNMAWLNSVGGTKQVNLHFSNNHLIPADKDIKKKVKAIKQNDYVVIDGYLVRSAWDNFTWGTSTRRDDTGNHACECIYVTDIKWLK